MTRVNDGAFALFAWGIVCGLTCGGNTVDKNWRDIIPGASVVHASGIAANAYIFANVPRSARIIEVILSAVAGAGLDMDIRSGQDIGGELKYVASAPAAGTSAIYFDAEIFRQNGIAVENTTGSSVAINFYK